MIKSLLKKNRSYRRFHQEKQISYDELKSLVDVTRYVASGRNLQPLRYYLSANEKTNRLIFPCLVWAGYLTNWSGPEEGERPSAYIVVCEDALVGSDANFDVGIAVQTILLAATEKGWGGCMVLSFNKADVAYALHLEENYKPVMVIALGYPKEVVELEEMEEGDSVKYWRDENGVHHVPKRKLDDIIIT